MNHKIKLIFEFNAIETLVNGYSKRHAKEATTLRSHFKSLLAKHAMIRG